MKKYYFLLLVLFLKVGNLEAQWFNVGHDYGNDKIVKNGNSIYLLGSRLYQSDNNGVTWELINTPAVAFNDIVFLPGKVVAATNRGIFISTDNCLSWTAHSTGMLDTLFGVQCLKLAGTRLLSICNSRAYYSNNNGDSWQLSNPTNVTEGYSISFSNTSVFLATAVGVWRSTDNGLTYTNSSTGINSPNAGIVELVEYNGLLFCHRYGSELYKSIDDGLTWQLAMNGLPTSNSTDVLSLVNSKLLFTTNDNVYEFNNALNTWNISSIGTANQGIQIIFYDQAKYFALNLEKNLIASIDNGITWINAASGLKMGFYVDMKVTANDKLFAIGTNGSYLLNNIDSTWNSFTPPLFDFGGTATAVYSSRINSIVYGAGNKYYVATDGGVWSSLDSGATWTQHYNGLPVTNVLFTYRTVNELLIVGDTIIAATPGGIYISIDQCLSWQQVNSSSSYTLVKYGSYIYSSGTGVLRSADNGATWSVLGGATSGGYYYQLAVAGGKVFTNNEFTGMLYSDTNSTTFSIANNIPIMSMYGYNDLLFYTGTIGSIKFLDVPSSLTTEFDAASNLPCYYYASGICSNIYIYHLSQYNTNLIQYHGDLWLATQNFGAYYRNLSDFYNIVGIKEGAASYREIWPNPMNEEININVPEQNNMITIFDFKGSVIMRNQLSIGSNKINTSSLSCGFYLYKIENNSGRVLSIGKLIKN